MIKLKYYFQF